MAGLSVFSNNWGTIHDFSQDPDEQHYSLLPEVIYLINFVFNVLSPVKKFLFLLW